MGPHREREKISDPGVVRTHDLRTDFLDRVWLDIPSNPLRLFQVTNSYLLLNYFCLIL